MNPNEPENPEQAAPAATDAEPGAAPKRPRRRRAPAPESGATAEASIPVVDAIGGQAIAAEAQAAPEASEAPPGGDSPHSGAGSEGREGRRRRRPRRRGRRQGQRAEGAPGPTDLQPLPRAPFPTLPSDDPEVVFAEVLKGDFDAQAVEPGGAAAPAATDEPAPGATPTEAGEAWDGEDEAFETEPPDHAPGPGTPPKRVLAPEPEAPKLHKILAQSGVGSRRDLEQMILEGRIAVNGQPAHVGQRISFGDRISIDGKPVRVRIHPPAPRVLAYHKPVGEIVTYDDPQQRPTVFRRLPRLQQGKWQSVGRLDINTEGLLLFTNSGDLANRLMHPRFGVEREYAVRVLGVLSDEERDRLLEGIEIEGHRVAARRIEDGGGDGANHWYRLVIAEGRNREVRRLFDAVGHAVSRLIRIRYGSVVLPRGLKRGVWVDLSPEDVRSLQRLTGTERREPGPGLGPDRADRPGQQRRRRRGRGGRQEGDERPPAGPTGAPAALHGDADDLEHHGPIPNPLQQTFDKRAIQQARKQRRFDEDGPIPNPLQQTFDRRALQQAERAPQHDVDDEDGPIPNPLQQTYDKRFAQGPKAGAGGGDMRGSGAGAGRRRKKGGSGGAGAPAGAAQPDPMRTAVGYIGADAALKGKGGRRGPRGRGR